MFPVGDGWAGLLANSNRYTGDSGGGPEGFAGGVQTMGGRGTDGVWSDGPQHSQ